MRGITLSYDILHENFTFKSYEAKLTNGVMHFGITGGGLSKKLNIRINKAGREMACFAVFFTIFKLLFLFGIKELGQSVAGKLVAKCLKKKSTDSKSLNSHLFPI